MATLDCCVPQIILCTPNLCDWEIEDNIYLYFWYRPEKQHKLLSRAEEVRTHEWDPVIVDHSLLTFPLILPPHVTDEQFISMLTERMEFCFRQDWRHY
jgi:hypothetical protein